MLATVLAILVMVLGSVLQAASGLGAGLVVVPLLSLITWDWVPGPCVAASLLLSGRMAYRGRGHWQRQHLGSMLLGLLAGIALGGVLVAALPLAALGALFGTLILGAVALSVAGLSLPFTAPAAGLAGALAGFMGTTAGIGAPVLALFYQRLTGAALRATLGLLYFVSSLVMLTALHLAGRFGLPEVGLALQLVPGVLAGYWLAGWLDRGRTRGAVRRQRLGLDGAKSGAIRLSGALAWWLWSVAPLLFLVDTRKRLLVAVEWFWAYLTFKRGTRLMTGSGA